jgi:putative intracellular protease/amidase
VLYPGFELLDVFGPVEMWANTPGFEIILIAEQAGPVTSAQGPAVTATHGFATAPDLDIMMVPGGIGTTAQLENPVLLDFLRRQDRHTEFTTSVCTGSALLARAGLLKGRRATSNKAYFSLATSQDASVDWIKKARWVEDGKLFTSSGVSAGTDMALALVARIHGIDQARSLARSLEYQWSEDADNDPFAIQ